MTFVCCWGGGWRAGGALSSSVSCRSRWNRPTQHRAPLLAFAQVHERVIDVGAHVRGQVLGLPDAGGVPSAAGAILRRWRREQVAAGGARKPRLRDGGASCWPRRAPRTALHPLCPEGRGGAAAARGGGRRARWLVGGMARARRANRAPEPRAATRLACAQLVT